MFLDALELAGGTKTDIWSKNGSGTNCSRLQSGTEVFEHITNQRRLANKSVKKSVKTFFKKLRNRSETRAGIEAAISGAFGPEHGRSRAVATTLATLYTELGKTEEAARFNVLAGDTP